MNWASFKLLSSSRFCTLWHMNMFNTFGSKECCKVFQCSQLSLNMYWMCSINAILKVLCINQSGMLPKNALKNNPLNSVIFSHIFFHFTYFHCVLLDFNQSDFTNYTITKYIGWRHQILKMRLTHWNLRCIFDSVSLYIICWYNVL